MLQIARNETSFEERLAAIGDSGALGLREHLLADPTLLAATIAFASRDGQSLLDVGDRGKGGGGAGQQ
jgi:hypothetical protein